MMTQVQQDIIIKHIKALTDENCIVKGIYSLITENFLYESTETTTIESENALISEEYSETNEIAEEYVEPEDEEDENPQIAAEKEARKREIEFNNQQKNAYLEALLHLLEKGESTRLKRYKSYQAYLNSEGQEKKSAFKKVLNYLLTEVNRYFAYLSAYNIDQKDVPFSFYFENKKVLGDEKKKDKIKIFPSDDLVRVEQQRNNKHSDWFDDVLVDELVEQRLEEEKRKQIKALLSKMSPDMKKALEVYYDQFEELEPLNVESNLLEELADKKGNSATINSLKALSHSGELSGIARFLKLAMATIKGIKNQYKKS